MYKRGETEEL